VTALVSTIVTTGASISPASGTARNFTTPVTYTVTAGDASTQSYTATVVQTATAAVTTSAIAGDLVFTVNVAGTSAKGGGNVTNQGGSAVTEKGLCWNTTGSPTIADAHAANGTGVGAFTTASMTGLTANTVYFVRAYATNTAGTAYGNEITLNSGRTFGTDYAGGYVFYNDGNGGGLVSAKTDQNGAQVWITGGSTATTLNGNTLTAIGTGLANSNFIVAQTGHTDSAAKTCLDYSDGTYSDWFLPSENEVSLMYTKLKLNSIGGFGSYVYSSSSEYDASYVWYVSFSSGTQYHDDTKSGFPNPVRAVRTF
jgi:hypothetical protein